MEYFLSNETKFKFILFCKFEISASKSSTSIKLGSVEIEYSILGYSKSLKNWTISFWDMAFWILRSRKVNHTHFKPLTTFWQML